MSQSKVGLTLFASASVAAVVRFFKQVWGLKGIDAHPQNVWCLKRRFSLACKLFLAHVDIRQKHIDTNLLPWLGSGYPLCLNGAV